MLRVNIKDLSSQVFQSSLIIFFFSCCCIVAAYHVPFYFSFVSQEDFSQTNVHSMVFFLFCNLVLFALLPIIYIWFGIKKPLPAYGICKPIITKKLVLGWLFAAIFCGVAIYYLVQQPSMISYYGQSRELTWQHFVIEQFTALPIYYIFEEFFFRGFLFLSLWRKLGWHGLWICEVIFAVAHFLKPVPEILFAIPVGIFLNLLTLWSRSIAPAWALHCLIGVCINFMIYFSLV